MNVIESAEVKVEPLTVLPELPSLTVITPEVPGEIGRAKVRVLAAPLASPIVVKPETLVRLSVPVLAKSSVRRPLPVSDPLTVTPLTVSVLSNSAVKVEPEAIVNVVERPELVKTGLDHARSRSCKGAAGHRAAVEDKVAG